MVVGFTRDYNSIRKAVMQAGDYDKTCLLEALKGSLLYCKEEWGNSTPCQVGRLESSLPITGILRLTTKWLTVCALFLGIPEAPK